MLEAAPTNFRKGNRRRFRSPIREQLWQCRQESVQVEPKKRAGLPRFHCCWYHCPSRSYREVSFLLWEAANPPFPTPRASKSFRAKKGQLSEALSRLGLD